MQFAQKFLGANEDFVMVLPDDIILSKIPAIKQLMNIHSKPMGVRLWVSKSSKKRSVEIWGDKNKKNMIIIIQFLT